MKAMGDFCRNDYSTARQPQDQLRPSALLDEIAPQPLACIFPRCKHHNTQSPGCLKKSILELDGWILEVFPHPVTSVPTFSPMTTRLRLCGRNKSKTMMGILLSMQSEKAVESITLSCCRKASR